MASATARALVSSLGVHTCSRKLGNSLDTSRVYFPGKLDYENYLHLLQRSDAHVYFTYPFVLSWSLREALSCGCAVIASDTAPVREFITSGVILAY